MSSLAQSSRCRLTPLPAGSAFICPIDGDTSRTYTTRVYPALPDMMIAIETELALQIMRQTYPTHVNCLHSEYATISVCLPMMTAELTSEGCSLATNLIN